MINNEILEKIKNWTRLDVESNTSFGSGSPYLRFGYWRSVDLNGLNGILKPYGLYCEEYDDYDDDCGYLFSYHLKNLK